MPQAMDAIRCTLSPACASHQRLSLARKHRDQANEITPFRFSSTPRMTGALVTIDRWDSNHASPRPSSARRRVYLLALKAIDGHALGCLRFFPDRRLDDPDAGKDHIQRSLPPRRGATSLSAVSWLFPERATREPRFPHLPMIGLVEPETNGGGRTEHERRYYSSSARSTPTPSPPPSSPLGQREPLAGVLDVVFHDYRRPPANRENLPLRASKQGHGRNTWP